MGMLTFLSKDLLQQIDQFVQTVGQNTVVLGIGWGSAGQKHAVLQRHEIRQ